MHGWLALEDGTVARGRGCGAAGTIAGELVFNTAMTGAGKPPPQVERCTFRLTTGTNHN